MFRNVCSRLIVVLDEQEKKTLWNPTTEVKAQRLPRYTVPIDAQAEFESEK